MPWVYTLRLALPTPAGVIQNDWENNIPGNAKIENAHGGVTVDGTRAVIVSQRNNPDFEEMANFGYVASIAEHKEIPSNPDPMELGLGIYCQFDDV